MPKNDPTVVHAAGRGNPWINLLDGRELPTTYSGAAGLEHVMERRLTVPTALASADFDEDGMPDLVSGYMGPTGGLITLHRGNVDFLFPNTPEARQRRGDQKTARRRDAETRRRGEGTVGQWRNEAINSSSHLLVDSLTQPSPFHPEAGVFELPGSPDFLGTGDFDADGHWDVVAAARGSEVLYLLSGDGKGGFSPVKQIPLPGAVTALVTGEINRADGLTDVAAGVVGPDGPQALVFESPEGALANVGQASPPASQTGRSAPLYEFFALPAEATALALGQLDESDEMDLAVAAGRELVIVHGRDRKLSLDNTRQAEVTPLKIEQHSFDFAIRSLALGDFVWDQEHRTDIALLGDDGAVHVMTKAKGKGQKAKGQDDVKWEINQLTTDHWPLATGLVRVKTSSLSTDDLVVLDSANHQFHILSPEGVLQPGTDAEHEFIVHHSSFSVPAVAVLPMRLNVDTLGDLVILKEGSTAPVVALTAPLATVTVSATTDDSDGDTFSITNLMASPGADGTISLREAMTAANNTAGADMIEFNIGAPTPTITLGGSLPVVTGVVTIDGSAGAGGATRVEINGNSATSALIALNIIAGSSTVRALVINRCTSRGIVLHTNGGNIIEGNFIGTDVNGTADLGNTFDGVLITNPSSNNTIGGLAAGSGNTIAFNGGAGVLVDTAAGTGNRIDPNSIFSNTGLGIDLGTAGVTANDAGDPDTGPNNLQNNPVMPTVQISTSGSLVIQYSVDSTTANSTYPLTIEFFKAASSGAGAQGKTFLGSDSYPSASAQMSKVVNLGNAAGLGVANGDPIVATATDANGNTSEFTSPSVAVGTGTLPTAVAVSSFTASVSEAAVVIQWETASERGLAGFNVLRAKAEQGLYLRINSAIIPARSSGSESGNRYVFADTTIPRRGRYFYILELIALDGSTQRHGPITVVVKTAGPADITLGNSVVGRVRMRGPHAYESDGRGP